MAIREQQIASFTNAAIQQTLGESAILTEDLSNIVEIGRELANSGAYDAYTRNLVNHIGSVVFEDRVYTGFAPNVMRDGWEFGSIREKIRVELPEADDNENWALVDGQSYDTNVFKAPPVHARFFNKLVTFEIPVSITRQQVKQSFSNSTQLGAFVAYIFAQVENGIVLRLDKLIMSLIANMAGETLYTDYNSGSSFSAASHLRAVNLLYEYNQRVGQADQVTADETDDAFCMRNPQFIKYMANKMKLYPRRLSGYSRLYNIEGVPTFTPSDKLRWVMLADVAAAADTYLNADTFHDDLVALPSTTIVPYWQGTGTDASFASVSAINLTTPDNHSVNTSGILAVCYDDEAVAVWNADKYVDTNHNGKASFDNYWYKYDAEYINDYDCNFVVFFIA